jgi:hypothetical protein
MQLDPRYVDKVTKMIEQASNILLQASNCTDSNQRRELLEHAFYAYTDILPYLTLLPHLKQPLLQQIKNIEKMLEMEIERSVHICSNS